MTGTLAALFFTTTVYLAVVLSIGYLLSVLIRSQVGASQIALVATLLPAMLLSGYVFPIDQMPPFIQKLTYLIYSRYYVTIIKAIFLKGAGMAELLAPILFLIVYAAFIANAMEGVIIDSDHWRHFYLLAAMVWGLMSARTVARPLIEAAWTTVRPRRPARLRPALSALSPPRRRRAPSIVGAPALA